MSARPWRAARRLAGFAPLAGAVWGLALAAALVPRVHRPAAVGQAAGYAAVHGFDPREDILRLLLLAAGSFSGGVVGAAIARRERPRHPRFAGRSRPADPVSRARQTVLGGRGLLLPAAMAHGITLWIFLARPMAERGLSPLKLLPALFLLSLGMAVALRRKGPTGMECLGAASPVLPLAFVSRPTNSLCWIAAAAAVLLPIVARLGARRYGTQLRALLVLVLLPGSILALAGAATLARPPVADLFEDGHVLLPASEYLRGERPYSDIVPGHGLLSDGLLAAAELRVFGDDYRGVRSAQRLNALFFWPAFYAIGWAATGSAAFGFWALLFSFLCFPMLLFLRVVVSLWLLALAVYASRRNRAWAWKTCGFLMPVALCHAADFAFYAAGSVAVALWVARGNRRNHLRSLLLGSVASAGAIALGLGAAGAFPGFLRTTFLFLPSLLPVYALGLPTLDVVKTMYGFEGRILYVFLALSLVTLGAFLPRAPAVGARARAALPIMAFTVLAMVSMIERQHLGHVFFTVPVGVLASGRLMRGYGPRTSVRAVAAIAGVSVVVFLIHPAAVATGVAVALIDRQAPAEAVAIRDPPRARGALYRPADARLVHATGEVLRLGGLGPEDTWIDFANTPGLYYLFGRDCPIRYYEVAFYESEAAQREVIEAIRRNPRIRAALRNSGLPTFEIDGVPNRTRAPLVEAFLVENFHPFYREGDVEFWLRNE